MQVHIAMSFAEHKETIADGDTIIIYEGPESLKPIVVKDGTILNNRFGNFPHAEMIGRPFGAKLYCKRTKGFVYLLHPTPELWTNALPHRTQILYSTDISMVAAHLDLRPGSVVVETGTGSGSLTHALIRTVAPTGHVYTFEFHKERSEAAHAEFEAHGVGQYVTSKHADACEDGFNLTNVADAVFLDLPKPWGALASAKQALKLEGGRICSFSPCIEQVQKTVEAMATMGFVDIQTFTFLQKTYDVREARFKEPNLSTPMTEMLAHDLGMAQAPAATEPAELRMLTAKPHVQMPGHTSYLSFATLPPQF